jgi:starch synthase
MSVLHVTAECYPAAKVGGLADVVGAVPKYMTGADVVMPKYSTSWFSNQTTEIVFEKTFWFPGQTIEFSIQKITSVDLGFTLFVVDIPGKFDRDGIYGGVDGFYTDDDERWLCFQRSVLIWLSNASLPYTVLHVHDHHTGLIPFMIKYSYDYSNLKHLKTVLTIHNLAYQGAFGWDRQYLLAAFDNWKSGLLDWDHHINPLASAIRCADWVTTVSPSYLEELKENSGGLEWLFNSEEEKCSGILNGIDTTVWNRQKDKYLAKRQTSTLTKFKLDNKIELCKELNIKPSNCIISFIGRMVEQKGADVLAYAAHQLLQKRTDINIVILGTGDPYLEDQFNILKEKYPGVTGITLAYDERLAHQIYAGSDFLIMPSRHEPCGLNQLYSMCYGTIPIVHNTGGLIDSVKDHKLKNGTGIKLNHLSVQSVVDGIKEAADIYKNTKLFNQLRENCISEDFSWKASSKKYQNIYESINH